MRSRPFSDGAAELLGPSGWLCCSGMSSDGSIGHDGVKSGGALPFFRLSFADNSAATVAVGWTGAWQANLTRVSARDGGGTVRLVTGMTTGVHPGSTAWRGLYARLRAGETVRGPSMALLYTDPPGPQQPPSGRAVNSWRRLMAEHFDGNQRPPTSSLPPPPAPAPVVAISLGPMTENSTTMLSDVANLKRVNVSGSDVNTLWLDAGWYVQDPNTSAPIGSGGRNWFDGYGNYSADPARFPRGLRPLSDAAHAAGLRFLLWFEPERVMKGNNEAYTIGRQRGFLRCLDASQQCLFDYGVPAAKDWMQRKM